MILTPMWKRHWCQRALEQLPDIFIVGFFRQDAVPVKNAARVGVDHKDRMISRIEKN